MKKICLYSIIILIVDFISKIIIRTNFSLSESIIVIPNFFSLTYVINSGCAFSFLEGYQYLFVIFGFVLLIVLFSYIIKEKLNNYKIISYSLLIGGILGNIIDRLIYNGVIDFLKFKLFSYNAPIFNLADTFIVIGTILVIIEKLIYKDGECNEIRSKRRSK